MYLRRQKMKEININNFEEKLYFDKLDNGLLVYLVPLKNKKNRKQKL